MRNLQPTTYNLLPNTVKLIDVYQEPDVVQTLLVFDKGDDGHRRCDGIHLPSLVHVLLEHAGSGPRKPMKTYI